MQGQQGQGQGQGMPPQLGGQQGLGQQGSPQFQLPGNGPPEFGMQQGGVGMGPGMSGMGPGMGNMGPGMGPGMGGPGGGQTTLTETTCLNYKFCIDSEEIECKEDTLGMLWTTDLIHSTPKESIHF